MNILHIINLIRAYFVENKKRLLIVSFVVFGVIAFSFTLSNEAEGALTMPFWCLFFTTCFTIFGFTKNRAHFFTLPSSTAEKFIYSLFVIVILWLVFYFWTLVGAYVGSYIIRPLFYLGTGEYALGKTNIFKESIFSLNYYLVHTAFLTVFLFGSIYFKKNALIKTLGIGIGFLFGLVFYLMGLLYIAFGTMHFNNDPYNFSFELASSSPLHVSFWDTHYYIILIAIIVFFLSLTYLRLKETEV